MRIAPEASLCDGWLDVVTIGDLGKGKLLQAFPRVYKGTHITHPKIYLERAKKVCIECENRILLQADGELLGSGMVSFQVLPTALSILV